MSTSMQSDSDSANSSSSVIVSDDEDAENTEQFRREFYSLNDSAPDVEHLSEYGSEASNEDEGHDDESGSSSDDEVNPVGDIPMRWYEGFDHIGYDRSGDQIIRKERRNALDIALDPHAWRKYVDEKTGEEIEISREELKQISRMRAGKLPGGGDGTEEEFIAWAGPVEKFPIRSGHEPKRRFLPSKHEAKKVVKLVQAMRAGLIPKRRPRSKTSEDDLSNTPYNYNVWEGYEEKPLEEMSRTERTRSMLRIPPPKVPLPENQESYNPPAEYLPSKKEVNKWEQMDEKKKQVSYLPTKYDSLRHVPLYKNYLRERFERCLDLYLAVRARKDRKQIDPDDLIPKLPSAKDLRPFPTGRVSTFGPLSSRARSISVHPKGQWLLSGSDDGRVRLWEVATGFLLSTFSLDEVVPKVDEKAAPVMNVAWAPRKSSYVFAVALHKVIVVMSAAEALGLSSSDCQTDIRTYIAEGVSTGPTTTTGGSIEWKYINADGDNISKVEEDTAIKRIEIHHARMLRSFTWHHRGDYIGAVGKDSSGAMVAIHRLSRKASQTPFRKQATNVQFIRFHPSRPFLFVATIHNVRVYNLAEKKAIKTLRPGTRHISSVSIHPSGDHVLVTSYDKRVCWFDLDYSTKPYRVLENHRKAVRVGAYHPTLPLWADGADDGAAHIFHGMVYDDLTKNALIVPLKSIDNLHRREQELGILDIAWHPKLPWLFTSGADRKIHLLGDLM